MKLSHKIGIIALLLLLVGVVSAMATTSSSQKGQKQSPSPIVVHTVGRYSTCLGEVLGELAKLNCKDEKAQYEVLGKVGHVTEGFDIKTICEAWPDTTSAFWREYSWSEIGTIGSGVGEVTCLWEIPK